MKGGGRWRRRPVDGLPGRHGGRDCSLYLMMILLKGGGYTV